MAKNGKLTFADLVEAYEVATESVELTEGVSVTVRELSGAERFEFSKFADAQEWETYRWLAFKGMQEPAAETIEDIDRLKPEWVVELARAVMGLSGITPEEEEAAAKKSEATIGTGSGSRETLDAA